MAGKVEMTPERVLLRAIYLSLKQKQRDQVCRLIEDAAIIDNVVNIRASHDRLRRAECARDAAIIAFRD